MLVLALGLLVGLPVVGSFIRWGGMPPGFGEFPLAHEPVKKPGPGVFYLVAGLVAAALILAFLLVPRWFGFHPADPRRQSQSRPLPAWFWAGAALNLASWGLHWWGPVEVAKYTFLPLWWGFIVALDGAVYARTGGRSLLSTEPRRMVLVTLVSVPAWTLFEYLNYFALGFWVYPVNWLFSPARQAAWYLVSFTTVLPAVFEWYTLLHSIEGIWGRWANGPRVRIPRTATGAVALVGYVALVLFAVFPFPLFVLLWVAPPIVLITALATLGYWTPLAPIERGSWSPVVLVGLASLANGVFWELWNFGSKYFHAPAVTNPNYWDYAIPYVNVGHFFSAMPVLGYFGYLFFGTLAWVCWLVAAHILDVEPDFDLTTARDVGGSLGEDLHPGPVTRRGALRHPEGSSLE